MNLRIARRFARFFTVGATGVAVNMGTLILLTEALGVPYPLSSLLAIELSILSNFALNNGWTWSDRRTAPLGERLLKYHAVAGFTALIANWSLLILLTAQFGLDYRISNAIGIATGTILNFALNHAWTFREQTGSARTDWRDWARRWATRCFNLRSIPFRWQVLLLSLLAAVLALRIAAMVWMTLVPEEAYYWVYSQHPSLSYYDHPPMVAWLIGLGTLVSGNTEFGVRLGIAVLMVASSGVMYTFGRMWFGRESALVAALLLQVLPVYFGTGLIATMDAAVVFFWLVCLVGVSVALRRRRAWGWYLAGLGLGGAMLSKYTGVFLGLGALLAVVGHRPWRWHLRSVHPYAATLLALTMFLPVIIWNAQHDWASFRFQFADRFAGQHFSAGNVGEYAVRQLAVATPLLLAGLAWACVRAARNRRRLLTPRWWISLCFCLPMLFVMSYKSLRSDIHLNWTLPLYLSALPAVVWLGLAQWRRARRSAFGFPWHRAAIGSVVGCLVVNAAFMVYVLAVQPRVGWISALGRWSELAQAVEAVEERLETETGHEPLVVADGKYRLASVLAFYRTPMETKVRASDFTTSQWITGGQGLGYPYWARDDHWAGSDCVVVANTNGIGQFAPQFDKFERVAECRLNRKVFAIAIGRGLHP